MNTELRKQLETLHVELGRTQSVDAESREMLVTLLGDISRLLDPSKPMPSDEQSLTERLDELAVQFEAEHPSLGTAIPDVLSLMANLSSLPDDP